MTSPADVRRKPAQKRGELRVQQILDATEALILEVGPEAVTTNHIARKAGVNVGTLYHFFSNKAEIFLAVLARSSAQVEAAIEQAVQPTSDEPESADEWITRLLQVQTDSWLQHIASVRLYDMLRSQLVTNAQVELSDERTVMLYCEGFARYCPHIPAVRRRPMARALLTIFYALIEDAIFASSSRDRQARLREIDPAVRSYLMNSN